DTVHIADPDTDGGGNINTVVAAPTVSVLLAKSRRAHQQFQSAAGHNPGNRGDIRHPDDDSAAPAIRDALAFRTAAEDADPSHTDPAWSEDQAANKGVTSATLIAFYEDYFAPEQPL